MEVQDFWEENLLGTSLEFLAKQYMNGFLRKLLENPWIYLK